MVVMQNLLRVKEVVEHYQGMFVKFFIYLVVEKSLSIQATECSMFIIQNLNF